VGVPEGVTDAVPEPRMSSCTVAEPSQPCSTVNPTLCTLPAGASCGSGSMCANTRVPPHAPHTMPVAATVAAMKRRIDNCIGLLVIS
jgi:hypothetical protein